MASMSEEYPGRITVHENPAAVKRAFETGGASVLAGARNFLDDLAHNGGRPRQADTAGFELGRNLAATPGKVVFRNELMELIQYAPQTGKVRGVPLLASPPWINKYHVMDLAPGRTWWEDWTAWADARAGRLGPPPPLGSERYPVLGEAPGNYVRG